jgi:hypothetical protein
MCSYACPSSSFEPGRRVFGDDILSLRRDKGKFVIRQLVEDFQLP